MTPEQEARARRMVPPGLRPSGRCFDSVLDFFTSAPRALLRRYTYTIVHGICLGPTDQPFAHAWIEADFDGQKLVLQSARSEEDGILVFFPMPADAFHDIYRVQDETRYTMEEADAENARTLSFGPWKEHYIALAVPR